jgi:hypothetical protein
VKEYPVLFSAPMVRAILSGAKTQTRRVVKPCKDRDLGCVLAPCEIAGEVNAGGLRNSVYGQPGDRLWVREAFMHEPADYCWEASVSIPCRPASTSYRADFDGDSRGAGWTPSIHMPRGLSRITLEITDVRVERLQDISEADAQAEGCLLECMTPTGNDSGSAIHGPGGFMALWKSINGADSWDANPWVWCVGFKRLEA